MTTVTDSGVTTAPEFPSCHAASNVTTAPTICTSSLAVVTADFPLLAIACRRNLLLDLLEEVRRRHRFAVLGYVPGYIPSALVTRIGWHITWTGDIKAR
jgi:hypothetical protein